MNALTITGNVVAKPEKVTLSDDRILANFRMGVSQKQTGGFVMCVKSGLEQTEVPFTCVGKS